MNKVKTLPAKLAHPYIKLPSTTFENLLSLRACESEDLCAELDKNDPNGTIYGHPYGIHLSYKNYLVTCFHKYGDNCKAYLAVKLDDIDLDASTVIDVETSQGLSLTFCPLAI